MTDIELRQAFSQYFKMDISIDAVTESYAIRAAMAEQKVDTDKVIELAKGITRFFNGEHGVHIVHAMIAAFGFLVSDFAESFADAERGEREGDIIYQALMLVVATGLVRTERVKET